MKKNYRKNAAVLVTDGEGRVLLCWRLDAPEFAQTVQGGVDDGEDLETAARRELEEELGLSSNDYQMMGALLGSYRYDWGPELLKKLAHTGFVGQDQWFFLARVAPEQVFDLDAVEREFDRVSWGTPEEMLEHAWEPKRPGLEAALRGFGLLSERE